MKQMCASTTTVSYATQLVVVSLLLVGCGPSMTPPRVYVAAPTGANTAEQLVENLKAAYATRDADAGMKLFYWDKGVPQDYWWPTLIEMFAAGYDEMKLVENDKTMDDPSNPTTLPVAYQLQIIRKTSSTRTENRTLLIGKTENGFYFTSPIWGEE